MKLKLRLAPVLMVLMGLPATAQEAGAASCMLAATPLAFGRYTPSSSRPADFTATLTVTCTGFSSTPIPLRATVALLGGAPGRRLADGPLSLKYQLYVDPARTVPWGDGAGGTETVSISGAVSSGSHFRQTLTVYGRVLARQSDARVGAYTDQVTAILEY